MGKMEELYPAIATVFGSLPEDMELIIAALNGDPGPLLKWEYEKKVENFGSTPSEWYGVAHVSWDDWGITITTPTSHREIIFPYPNQDEDEGITINFGDWGSARAAFDVLLSLIQENPDTKVTYKTLSDSGVVSKNKFACHLDFSDYIQALDAFNKAKDDMSFEVDGEEKKLFRYYFNIDNRSLGCMHPEIYLYDGDNNRYIWSGKWIIEPKGEDENV